MRIWTYKHPESAAWREVEIYGLSTAATTSPKTTTASSNSLPTQTQQSQPAPSSNTTVSNDIENAFSNDPSKAVSKGGKQQVQISRQNPAIRVAKFFEDLFAVIIGSDK